MDWRLLLQRKGLEWSGAGGFVSVTAGKRAEMAA